MIQQKLDHEKKLQRAKYKLAHPDEEDSEYGSEDVESPSPSPSPGAIESEDY